MKNKLFIGSFLFLAIAVLVYTFLNIYVYKNYQIITQVSCDTAEGSCFAYTTEEGTIDYYKYISKKASDVQNCIETINQIDCNPELICSTGEVSCEYTYCTSDTVDEDSWCTE